MEPVVGLNDVIVPMTYIVTEAVLKKPREAL